MKIYINIINKIKTDIMKAKEILIEKNQNIIKFKSNLNQKKKSKIYHKNNNLKNIQIIQIKDHWVYMKIEIT